MLDRVCGLPSGPAAGGVGASGQLFRSDALDDLRAHVSAHLEWSSSEMRSESCHAQVSEFVVILTRYTSMRPVEYRAWCWPTN